MAKCLSVESSGAVPHREAAEVQKRLEFGRKVEPLGQNHRARLTSMSPFHGKIGIVVNADDHDLVRRVV